MPHTCTLRPRPHPCPPSTQCHSHVLPRTQDVTASFQQLLNAKDEALGTAREQIQALEQQLAASQARGDGLEEELGGVREALAARDAEIRELTRELTSRLAERDAAVAGLAAQAMELRVALAAKVGGHRRWRECWSIL